MPAAPKLTTFSSRKARIFSRARESSAKRACTASTTFFSSPGNMRLPNVSSALTSQASCGISHASNPSLSGPAPTLITGRRKTNAKSKITPEISLTISCARDNDAKPSGCRSHSTLSKGKSSCASLSINSGSDTKLCGCGRRIT